MSSTLRCASRSSRRLDWMRLQHRRVVRRPARRRVNPNEPKRIQIKPIDEAAAPKKSDASV